MKINWYKGIRLIISVIFMILLVVAYFTRLYIDTAVTRKLSESNIYESVSTQTDLIREEIRIMQGETSNLREKIVNESNYYNEFHKLNSNRIKNLENEVLLLKENQ